MAKKQTTDSEAAPAINPEAYYRVTANARFKAFGVGFGGLSTTEVSGAALSKLLASEHAGKIESWTAV